jgi:hypothetical protein
MQRRWEPGWRRNVIGAIAAATAAAGLSLSDSALALDRPATPSTLASVFAAALPGDTVVLGSGNYGRFEGSNKSGLVTVKAAPGATASMSLWTSAENLRLDGLVITGGYIDGARNLSVVNSKVTGYLRVDATETAHGILLDNDTFDGINLPANAYEGRLSIRGYNNTGAVGVQIRNSHFGNGGCSDGVQIVGGANGVQVGPGNEFEDLRVGSCDEHVDSIQLYGSRNTQIVGNYFHDSSTHIMAPDGGNGEVISDNVMVGSDYRPAVQLGSHDGTSFTHNTVRNVNVHMDSKTGGRASRNGVIRDNVMVGGGFNTTSGSGCQSCTVSHNLFSGGAWASGSNSIVGNPVFVGGSNPTSYAGHALASGSPGKGNASDGTDRGIRVGNAPAPNPTPIPNPPSDVPAKAVWTVPVGARVGTAVTLDGSASEGNDPLACTWRFENQDGSVLWETITGCKIQKTFQYVGTKYVSLTVRDNDGDTDTNRQTFAVAAPYAR